MCTPSIMKSIVYWEARLGKPYNTLGFEQMAEIVQTMFSRENIFIVIQISLKCVS